MRFHILTLFPNIFESPFTAGVIDRACRKGLIGIEVSDIRNFSHNRRRTVDDYQFGGGAGMLLKPEPLFEAVESVKQASELDSSAHVTLLSPQGRLLTQKVVEELSELPDIVLICGRYEGVDERVRQYLANDEISIGDYVLSGGEVAAMVVVEAVARLLTGVVGSVESIRNDSITTGLLQYPQYTRPAEFRGWDVPEVLVSGNHLEIERWRRRESLRRTLIRRPDLLSKADLSQEDRQTVIQLSEEVTDENN